MYFVYILANWNNKVLYTGVTNNLERRLYEHRNKLADGFTKKYNVHKLVYFDYTADVNSAIAREKQIKGWTRAKKNALVEELNSEWHDLSEDWGGRFFTTFRMTDGGGTGVAPRQISNFLIDIALIAVSRVLRYFPYKQAIALTVYS